MAKPKRDKVLPVPMRCPDGVVRLTWSKDVFLADGSWVSLTLWKSEEEK